ncbi:MAG: SAM-dependent chlorinase/fluorinase [Bryobacterales bacterium]|nr:SAM-dependent chlorinase/fluorinase [Bryobacterales bacterium]
MSHRAAAAGSSEVAEGRGGPLLTLTTDFGLRDHYVGVMKGVIAGIAPEVGVIDITHDVPAFSIPEGAFAILQAYRWFPSGTAHVVVVDPGVGSHRNAVAARAGGHVFVAPDNGVLSFVFERHPEFEVRAIDTRHGLAEISRTFHGRDLFAPAAARLMAGLRFDQVGPRVREPVMLHSMEPTARRGRVLHVDRFGNLVTNFRAGQLGSREGLQLGSASVFVRVESYAEAPAGDPFLIEGSSGYLEVSANRASAAQLLGVRAGAEIAICPPDGGNSREP